MEQTVIRGSFPLDGDIVAPEFALHDARLERALACQGNWRAVRALGIDHGIFLEAAEDWRRDIGDIRHPWLCWNVDSDWSYAQQCLVKRAGWTPLVGYDPRVGPPSHLVNGAVVYDFNRRLQMPFMYPHVPVELCFAFIDRLAFWHSDLLLTEALMLDTAERFRALPDGQTAATYVSPGLRHSFSTRQKRYWELVGCTTRRASRSQWDNGCGWWMAFWCHPNMRAEERAPAQARFYWDHGSGVYYWRKQHGGNVVELRGAAYEEGHFTKIGNSKYQKLTSRRGSDAERRMSDEIKHNFDIRDAVAKMGLTHLIDI